MEAFDLKATDKLQELMELSRLYDFYGELLGEHKKKILKIMY